ncbi:hypothetical protein [Schaalia sp. ZJ1691]|uniref:hypothetical protein n=1 Tax=Schaalia sp. ZJ1691 TaxID=2709404 RepID=UPI0013EAFF18|nr:hypothetical protein [Schaalia sp. ZJ1691]
MGELEAHPQGAIEAEKMHFQDDGNRWWFSQRTHVVGYAARIAYEAEKAKKSPKTARDVWNGLRRPEPRMWVIEALGLIRDSDRESLLDEFRQIPHGTGRGKKHAPHRKFLKKRYPWDEIEAAAKAKYIELEATDNARYPRESRRQC